MGPTRHHKPMSKLTSTPPKATRRAIKTKVAAPVKAPVAKSVVTPKQQTTVDKTITSSDAKSPEESSGRASSLISGLTNWMTGADKTPDAKGETKADAKPEAPAMTLDKGELLRKGSKGAKVTQLQDMLNSRGAKLDADGKFGPKTRAALRTFQRENKLAVDGVFGPDTLSALNGAGEAKAGIPAKDGAKAPVDEAGKGEVGKGDTPKAGKNGRFANTRDSLNKLPGPLKKYANTFQAAGEKYGVDPRFLAAISMHETGNGRSSAFRNKNNAMGISSRRGPVRMSSVEASIEKMAKTLAKPTGYYRGKTTIGQIGRVYAPKGAANDPTGLNGYWPKGVANNFRKFGGNPTQNVIFRQS